MTQYYLIMPRNLIPVRAEAESLCRNCNGACCHRGTILELNDDEKAFMEDGGAQLVDSGLPTRTQEEAKLREVLGDLFDTVHTFISDATEHPRYLLLEDCPYLVRTTGSMAVCSVYDNPEKPAICSSFKADSPKCHEIRDLRFLNVAQT